MMVADAQPTPGGSRGSHILTVHIREGGPHMVRPRILLSLTLTALVAVAAVAFLLTPDVSAAKADDEKAVRQAVLDYVEGIYEVDPARIERSVHKDLRKAGFYYDDEEKGYKGPHPMTYQQLYELAGDWNKDRHIEAATAVKKVEIYEVLDMTASVKLTADWGIDYMQLGKFDGRWMIFNVLWQSPPRTD